MTKELKAVEEIIGQSWLNTNARSDLLKLKKPIKELEKLNKKQCHSLATVLVELQDKKLQQVQIQAHKRFRGELQEMQASKNKIIKKLLEKYKKELEDLENQVIEAQKSEQEMAKKYDKSIKPIEDMVNQLNNFMTLNQLKRSSNKDFGLGYYEALEMAYDNMRLIAKKLKQAIKTIGKKIG